MRSSRRLRLGTVQTLKGHSGLVSDVIFSPDGKLLASASNYKTIRIWDAGAGATSIGVLGQDSQAEGRRFGSGTTDAQGPFGLGYRGGKQLASASFEETIRPWTPTSGAGLQRSEGHWGGVMGLSFP